MNLLKRRGPYPEQFSEDLDLAPPDGEVRTYLIASTPRSGSHLLGHALKEAGSFGVPLEYIHHKNFKLWAQRFRTKGASATMAEIMRHRTGSTGWFGLKAHWNQLSLFRKRHGLEPLGDIRSIFWIYRRDLLGQAISFAIAEQTGQWISGAPKLKEPEYDQAAIVKGAIKLRDQNTSWERFISSHSAKVVRVAYEDLINPELRPGLINEMLSTLSAQPLARPPETNRVQRQANSLNREWREKFTKCAGPQLRWMLEPLH